MTNEQINRLIDLQKLYEEGILNEDDLAKEKAKILNPEPQVTENPTPAEEITVVAEQTPAGPQPNVSPNVEKMKELFEKYKIPIIAVAGVLVLSAIIGVVYSLNSKTEEPAQVAKQPTQQQVVQQPAQNTAKVYNYPTVKNAPNKMRVSIVRVVLADDYTAIECAVDNTHGAYSYIAIDSETWITPNESHIVEEQLTRTDGIAISPGKTAIPKGKVTPFTLYFPPIDKGTDVLDLEESGKTGWKFYGIKLN